MDVVLLHGLGADKRAWQRFVRLLPSEWNVEPIDLLGHGDAPKPDTGYGLAEYGRYVATQLPAGGATIVGHSLGASAGVACAALHPDLVEQLVLLDPPLPGGTVSFKTGGRTKRMIESKLGGADMRVTIDELFPEFSEPLRAWTAETWQQMAPGAVRELDHDWSVFAAGVRCHVDVLHGDVEHGGYGPGGAGQFASSHEFRVEGAGHYLHATHARFVADIVSDCVGSAHTAGAPSA
jgi:pimeloyl-ACP methyl ester carboxylesterase